MGMTATVFAAEAVLRQQLLRKAAAVPVYKPVKLRTSCHACGAPLHGFMCAYCKTINSTVQETL